MIVGYPLILKHHRKYGLLYGSSCASITLTFRYNIIELNDRLGDRNSRREHGKTRKQLGTEATHCCYQRQKRGGLSMEYIQKCERPQMEVVDLIYVMPLFSVTREWQYERRNEI